MLLFFTLEALEEDEAAAVAAEDDDDDEEEDDDGDGAGTLRPENDLPEELGEAILECAAA